MSSNPTASQAKSRKDASHRRRVVQIAQALSATLGHNFFGAIVKYLSTAFKEDCVYLGELTGTPADRIRTLAVSRDQSSSAEFDQKLPGTAADQVLSDGYFACSRDVRRLFPLDELLGKLDTEGYVGVRLSDSAGQPMGLLAVLSKDGLANMHLVKSVLETFAVRAAAELERKRSDDLRRENEERHQAFISSNPDAMWRIEFEQPVPLDLSEEEQIDLVYRFGYLAECNDAVARLAGASRAEALVGSRFGDIVDQINPSAREELRSAIHSGFRTTTVETNQESSGGRTLYRIRSQFGIVENGSLRRLWGTTRDLTDLRWTELSLAASEKRFREVLEGVHLPAVMLDLTGKITFANEHFLLLSQRSGEQLQAVTWLDGIVPPSESETWKAALQPDQTGRYTSIHFEGAITPGSGPARAVAWDTIGLYNNHNQLEGLAAIGQDITRERALQTEIRQAQKLDSIGRLAGGVAHDFNNLLTVILGEAFQLQQEVKGSVQARQRLAAIQTAADQCTRLTGQLLAFGRKQDLRPRLVNMNEVITGEEGIIRSLIGDSVELIMNLSSSIGLVYVDAAQIQRVVANLVTNARDAMPDGGTITILTANVTIRADNIDFPALVPGPYVRLSVFDTGVGLTEDTRVHLFEPFFTTKAPGKGTGLGLSTVYGIVTQSGGQISVHSEPGVGTRFDILLPIARV